MEWQPIDTAPQNVAILLYASGYHIGHLHSKDGRWWINGGSDGAQQALNSWNRPTHWMPLPKKPDFRNQQLSS